DPAERAELVAAFKKFAAGCEERSQRVLPHVSMRSAPFARGSDTPGPGPRDDPGEQVHSLCARRPVSQVSSPA
ncbi:hypothetical protein, partial [Streptomyces sp. NPDC041003]|uniref:hypothetical protein n=1 Tax=Streptomyces sp. NPDC041003 TaxID=3155730 RepID=UPI0033E52268